MTTPHHLPAGLAAHQERILAAVAAELAPFLVQKQTGRITLNISGGGSVRLEVARYKDIAGVRREERVASKTQRRKAGAKND